MAEAAAELPEGALDLGAAGEAEWRRLGRQLYRAQGFWLGVLFASATAEVAELWRRTRQRLRLKGRSCVRFIAQRPADLADAYRWLEAAATQGLGCCWIEGLAEDPDAWSEEWTRLLVQLNRNRERIWARHPHGVLLVLPEVCKARFLQAAPDLWSIRNLVMTLPDPEPREDEGFALAPRAAYSELRNFLHHGSHVIVVAPPGAGASTLRRQAIAALQEEGALCASLDMRTLSQREARPEQWVEAAMANLGAQLGWDHPSYLLDDSPAPRFLFLDQTDAVLDTTLLRQALASLLRTVVGFGITVCMLGAAFPESLWENPADQLAWQTVWLDDLSVIEVPWSEWAGGPLAAALRDEVWRWTAGHPALTRLVLQYAITHAADGEPADVEQVIENQLLERAPLSALPPVWSLHVERGGQHADALRLHRRLLDAELLQLDPWNDAHGAPAWQALQALWRSGLVARDGAGEPVRLRVRSLLHARLFDKPWVDFELLRVPTAPSVSLEDDYEHAVLHIATYEHPGETVLLLATIELLPRGMMPPVDDGAVVCRGTEGNARLRHLPLAAPAALRWYQGCAAGLARIPPQNGGMEEGLGIAFTAEESCAWPLLLCGILDDYPFRAGWHEAPRVHVLQAAQPVAERLGADREGILAWLETHLYRPLKDRWLGMVTLTAPNPLFRYLDMRLDPGNDSDAILFRIWRYPGRTEEVKVHLYEEETMRPHIHTATMAGRSARLLLDHRIRAQKETVFDSKRGAIYYSGPGVFLREIRTEIKVNGKPGLAVSLTR